MSELDPKGSTPTKKVLESSSRIVLDNGDILFTSNNYTDDLFPSDLTEPFQLRMNPEGVLLADKYPSILSMLDIRQRKKVIKKTVGRGQDKTTIAIKEMVGDNLDLTGLQLFQAFSDLESEGVICASPLMATRWKFVSKWVSGRDVDEDTEERKRHEYLKGLVIIVEKLCSQGRWDPLWGINTPGDNFIARDLDSPNILEWFTTIDTVIAYPDQRVKNVFHGLYQ